MQRLICMQLFVQSVGHCMLRSRQEGGALCAEVSPGGRDIVC